MDSKGFIIMKGIMKFATIMILVLVTSISFVACGSEPVECEVGENLVVNGSFEEGADGLTGWEVVGAEEGSSATIQIGERSSGIAQADELGTKYLIVNNGDRNETYIKQKIRLEKGATYRLESKINVTKAITGDAEKGFYGAYIGMEENRTFMPIGTKISKDGSWDSSSVYAYYFTSEFDTITLTVRLGLSGKEAKGTAEFDGIKLYKVDETTLAEDAKIHLLDAYVPDNGGVPGVLYLVLGIVIVFALSYGIYVAIRRTGYLNGKEVENKNKFLTFISKWYPLFILLFVSIVVRVVLSLLYVGNGTDVEGASGASVRLASQGLASFFASSSQKVLPFYAYILWAMGGVINLFGAKGAGLYMIAKLPAIISELLTIVLIYKLANKFIGKRGAILCGALYAFIPSVLTVSSVWGAKDSITAFIALMSLYLVMNPYDMKDTARYISIFVCLLIGSMTTIEFLWLVPVIGAYLVFTFIKKKELRLTLGICAGSALVLFYLLAIPTCINYISNGRVFYVFEKYFEFLFGGVRYYSKDAFNLYAIVGLNWRSVSKLSIIMNAVFALILFAFVIFVYFKNKSRIELILLAGFTMIGAYTFAIDMTPAVLVIGITLVFAYSIIVNEKRTLLLSVIYFALLFLNCTVLLNNGGALSSYIASTARFLTGDAFLIIMSVINLLTFFLFVYLVYDICINEKIKQIEFIEGRDLATLWGKFTYKIRRK